MCQPNPLEPEPEPWVDFAWSKSGEHSAAAAGPTSSPARFDVTGLTSLSTNHSRSRDQPTNERAGRGCHTGKWGCGAERRAAPKFHHQGGRWWCGRLAPRHVATPEEKRDAGSEQHLRTSRQNLWVPLPPAAGHACCQWKASMGCDREWAGEHLSDCGGFAAGQEAAGRENGWCQL